MIRTFWLFPQTSDWRQVYLHGKLSTVPPIVILNVSQDLWSQLASQDVLRSFVSPPFRTNLGHGKNLLLRSFYCDTPFFVLSGFIGRHFFELGPGVLYVTIFVQFWLIFQIDFSNCCKALLVFRTDHKDHDSRGKNAQMQQNFSKFSRFPVNGPLLGPTSTAFESLSPNLQGNGWRVKKDPLYQHKANEIARKILTIHPKVFLLPLKPFLLRSTICGRGRLNWTGWSISILIRSNIPAKARLFPSCGRRWNGIIWKIMRRLTIIFIKNNLY